VYKPIGYFCIFIQASMWYHHSL